MAYSIDRFKNANSHDELPTAVPAFGTAVEVGPHGRAVVTTHSITDVTDYDVALQVSSGNLDWVDVPYVYEKGAKPTSPTYLTAENLPVGSWVRVSVPRIGGDEGILSTSIMTDIFNR